MRPLVADMSKRGFELASKETQCAGERQGAQLDPGNFIGGRKIDADRQPWRLIKYAFKRVNVLGGDPDCIVVFWPPVRPVFTQFLPWAGFGSRRVCCGFRSLVSWGV